MPILTCTLCEKDKNKEWMFGIKEEVLSGVSKTLKDSFEGINNSSRVESLEILVKDNYLMAKVIFITVLLNSSLLQDIGMVGYRRHIDCFETPTEPLGEYKHTLRNFKEACGFGKEVNPPEYAKPIVELMPKFITESLHVTDVTDETCPALKEIIELFQENPDVRRAVCFMFVITTTRELEKKSLFDEIMERCSSK